MSFPNDHPSAEDVRAVLDNAPVRAEDMLAAALHLATPVSELVGVQVRRDGDSWTWRNLTVPAVRLDARSAAQSAATMAQLGWQNGDQALNLTDRPGGWVKPVVSGSRRIAYGCELLAGVVVASESSGDEAVLRSVAAHAISGDVTAPAVLDAEGTVVLVEGDARYWMVRSATGGPQHGADPFEVQHPLLTPGDDDVADVCDWVGSTLGGVAVAEQLGSRVAGTIDVEVTVTLAGGWLVRVPAVVAVGAELIGIAASDSVGVAQSAVPDGYTVEGALASNEVLATHIESGLRVAVRRSS